MDTPPREPDIWKGAGGIMRFAGASIALGAVLIALGTQAGAADSGAKGADKPAVKAAEKSPAKTAEKAAGATDGGVVAKVNGVGLPRADFDRSWAFFLQRSGIPSNHAEKDGQVTEFRKQVLDRLIDEELLFQEAKSLKMIVGKDVVDAQIEKSRSQFPTTEAFKEALAKNQLTEDGLRKVFSRNLSIQAYVEKKIAKDITVSDAEVHDFYTGNKDKFESPEQAHARHILVTVDEKADDQTRQAQKAKAEDLLAQLKGGADFGELAKKNSDCPSAPEGGDLGFFGHGQMVPEFDAAAFALKPGELSEVVTTKFGYHIIKLDEKKEAGLVAETDAAPKIREYLVSEKTGAALEQKLKALREKAKIEVVMKL
jgi:peptidyl-prolyl cis-trans isomerase C